MSDAERDEELLIALLDLYITMTISEGYVFVFDYADLVKLLPWGLEPYRNKEDILRKMVALGENALYDIFSSAFEESTWLKPMKVKDFIWLCPKNIDEELLRFLTSLNMARPNMKALLSKVTHGYLADALLREGKPPYRVWHYVFYEVAKSWGIGYEESIKKEEKISGWIVSFTSMRVVELPLKQGVDRKYLLLLLGSLYREKRKGKMYHLCFYGYTSKKDPDEIIHDLRSNSDVVTFIDIIEAYENLDATLRDVVSMLMSRCYVEPSPTFSSLEINFMNISKEMCEKVRVGLVALFSVLWPSCLLFGWSLIRRNAYTAKAIPMTLNTVVTKEISRIMSLVGVFQELYSIVDLEGLSRSMWREKLGLGDWCAKALLSLLGLA